MWFFAFTYLGIHHHRNSCFSFNNHFSNYRYNVMDCWILLFHHDLHCCLEHGWWSFSELCLWGGRITSQEIYERSGYWNQLLRNTIFNPHDYRYSSLSRTSSGGNILLLNSFSLPCNLIHHILASLLERELYLWTMETMIRLFTHRYITCITIKSTKSTAARIQRELSKKD